MSYYLRVIDRKDNTDICSIHSTLSDAIDALSKVEIGTFVSLTTKIPRIKKCMSCVTRKAHDYLLDENIQLREALAEIKKTVECAQDTVYPIHIALDSKDGLHILEIAKQALKGGEQ